MEGLEKSSVTFVGLFEFTLTGGGGGGRKVSLVLTYQGMRCTPSELRQITLNSKYLVIFRRRSFSRFVLRVLRFGGGRLLARARFTLTISLSLLLVVRRRGYSAPCVAPASDFNDLMLIFYLPRRLRSALSLPRNVRRQTMKL